MEIAAAAVALLAPYLAEAGKSIAGKAGDAAAAGIAALHERLRHRFRDDDDAYAQQSLTRLEEEPADERRQRALADVLAEKAEADAAFAEELRELVGTASGGRPVNEFLVEVYGGEVGKIVQIGQAGDVRF